MLSKKLKIKKGLTLLELIIVLGLMSIVSMLVFSFTNITQKKSNELDKKQKLQYEANVINENFMSHILETTGIEKINFVVGDRSKLEDISFRLNGTYKFKLASSEETVDKIKYRAESNMLKMLGHKVQPNECTPFCTVEGHWAYVSEVTSNLKEMSFQNEELESLIQTGTDEEINDLVRTQKGVKIKLILKDTYQGQEILHEHTVELNLRNAK